MDNEQLSKQTLVRKHRIRMSFLISKKDFQKSVQKIRNHLKIPDIGLSFKKEKSKQFDDWWSWYAEQNDYEIRKIEKTIKDLYIKQSENLFEEKQKLLLRVPKNYLNNQIDNVLDQYCLPVLYQKTIYWYILYNEIKVPSKNYFIRFDYSKISNSIETELDENLKGKSKKILIEIYAPLDDKEIKELISNLKVFQKGVFPKGLLTQIRPDMKVEEIIKLAKTFDEGKSTSGQPKKEMEYLHNSSYFQLLKKQGFSEKKIHQIAIEQKFMGNKLDIKRKKVQITSGDVAKKQLGSHKKSSVVRKASHKFKKYQKDLFDK